MYEFKQAVKISGLTFNLGKHNVPDNIVEHPDFLHFVNCGWIAEVDANKSTAPQQETFSMRAQRLAKKLAEKTEKDEPVREPVQEKETSKGKKAKAEKGE